MWAMVHPVMPVLLPPADSDSVLVDAILFSVIVEFFNNNIGILSLSWVLDKRSISVVDKELNKISIERRTRS